MDMSRLESPAIPKSLSLDLYRDMYRIRRSEELIISHYPEDEMKTPMHMSMGQEAIAVGVCRALHRDDQVYVSYRSHAVFLAKTGDTDAFFAELYGKVGGTARGKGGSMHLAAPERGHMLSSAVVGSAIPVAVGAAFAALRKGTGRVSCAFFGDGAPDEGVFWESLNLACVMKLPVLFVCEDNGLAVHTSKATRQGYRDIVDVVSGFECSVYADDAHDVEVVYTLASEALASIKTTGRPSFLNLRCYRYLEHVGINEDFDAGYRPRAEYDEWRKRDSLDLQRSRLAAGGHSESEIASLERDVESKVKTSVAKAQQDDLPGTDELMKGVFHEED